MKGSSIYNCLGLAAPLVYLSKGSLNESIMTMFVEQPLALPGSVNDT